MFQLSRSYERDSLIAVVCQCSMRTAFTWNMDEDFFYVIIVNRCFVLFFSKVSVQALFRHQYNLKSSGLAPVSEKTRKKRHPPVVWRRRTQSCSQTSGCHTLQLLPCFCCIQRLPVTRDLLLQSEALPVIG